ncbi:uncharacterized protein [Elaeis guineensis]|uniref:Uncharacterized protein LOC109505875 n=1 Tax=Elaeis guineensis var. tenera TaxID=51953 RepID=A0A6J0PJ33_ELAGV|nr:uncharacterized protein LOC109505875 [Elaeis guineensis]
MASPQPPPTTPANEHEAAPPPHSLHRPQRRLWSRFRLSSCLPSPCLRPKKVLIHSSWITLVGLFLIRLATADTSSATEARVFAIAGAAVASLPWLLIFLATAAITVFFEAGICDLTWIFSGSGGGPPRRKHRQEQNAEDDGSDDAIGAAARARGGGAADEGAGKDGTCLPSAVDEASTSSAAPAAAEAASPP